jgi:hypothetical protein
LECLRNSPNTILAIDRNTILTVDTAQSEIMQISTADDCIYLKFVSFNSVQSSQLKTGLR